MTALTESGSTDHAQTIGDALCRVLSTCVNGVTMRSQIATRRPCPSRSRMAVRLEDGSGDAPGYKKLLWVGGKGHLRFFTAYIYHFNLGLAICFYLGRLNFTLNAANPRKSFLQVGIRA